MPNMHDIILFLLKCALSMDRRHDLKTFLPPRLHMTVTSSAVSPFFYGKYTPVNRFEKLAKAPNNSTCPAQPRASSGFSLTSLPIYLNSLVPIRLSHSKRPLCPLWQTIKSYSRPFTYPMTLPSVARSPKTSIQNAFTFLRFHRTP